MNRTALAFLVITFGGTATAQTRPVATAIVHVDATNPAVELESMRPKQDWVVACTGPCDRALPTNGSYRIAGSGIRYSDPFTLTTSPNGKVIVHAATKSSVLHATGLILLGVGIATAGVGGFMAVFAALGSISGTINQSILTAGLVTGGFGLATIVPGVVLSVMTGSSTVTF